MLKPLAVLILMLVATTPLSACVSRFIAPSEVPMTLVAVDDDCHGAGTLERDLSDAGVYRGAEQIYLNDQGRSCRYAQ